MKQYILFSLLLALPLSLAAQSTIRRPSKPKQKPKVENSKPKPRPEPKTKSRTSSTSPPLSSPQPAPQITPQQAELNKLINNMVYVSGGTFTMGATSEQGHDAEDDEKPAHSVTLSDFYLCKYEVTQALWKAVMEENPSYYKGDNLPVEQVGWDECQTFIARLNSLTGKCFRLPTEAEWEYAARGGNCSRGYKYSGSNKLSDVAWYFDNSDNKTHPVGTKNPNELGLYDMSGNVQEWCYDWYGDYSSSSQTNPTGPSDSKWGRVYRGGGWRNDEKSCRPFFRWSYASGFDYHEDLGFRLAISNL